MRKEIEELKRKKAQERLEALRKTAVGARALADLTPEASNAAYVPFLE